MENLTLHCIQLSEMILATQDFVGINSCGGQHTHSDLLCHQNICTSILAEAKPVRNTSFSLGFSAARSLQIAL